MNFRVGGMSKASLWGEVLSRESERGELGGEALLRLSGQGEAGSRVGEGGEFRGAASLRISGAGVSGAGEEDSSDSRLKSSWSLR